MTRHLAVDEDADGDPASGRAAVVVAGGRSTRFGDADKAVAALAGTPMIRRVADRLVSVVDELIVNCRADQHDLIREALDGLDPQFALDPETDRGPMAGMLVGLRAVDAPFAAVVACDMPFVEPGLVDFLFKCAKGHDAAVPRHGEWYETTQAVYRADAMAAACERALADGERKILAPLTHLDWYEVPEAEWREHGDPESFQNLNTREEFDDAAECFG